MRWQALAEREFTLVLSAGFFGFFAHAGLLVALERCGVRPRRVVGVSAGALAGGLWASGIGAQSIADTLLSLRREEFWDPGFPWGGLLRGQKFLEKLQRELAATGVQRIEDCPTRFTAVAHDVFSGRARPLAHGRLDSAIVASCTVPVMFRPIWRDGRLLVDGGLSDRLGATALSAGERALVHWLPSHRASWPRPERGASLPADAAGRDLLVVPGLPRVHPYALERGATAYRVALDFSLRWLTSEAAAS